MPFSVDIAGFSIGIKVSENTRSALKFCKSYFERFPGSTGAPVATVSIIRPSISNKPEAVCGNIMEHLITAAQLTQRVGTAYTFADDTICVGCMDAGLAYQPATKSAQLFLCGADPAVYSPLFRLLWMFFAQSLGELGCFFVHAAAIACGDRGQLFCGDSGEGKTTLAGNAKSGVVLADDGPVVTRGRDTEFRIHTSPYHQGPVHGRHWNRKTGASCSLEAIYFLDKTGRHKNRRISPSQSVPYILQRFTHFWGYLSPAARVAAFDLFADACHSMPVRYLTVPMGADALTLIDQPYFKGCST